MIENKSFDKIICRKNSLIILFFIFRSFDAICQTFDLEVDDIIILSTDGLFDNVPDYIIEQILSQVSWIFISNINLCFFFLLESFFKTCC